MVVVVGVVAVAVVLVADKKMTYRLVSKVEGQPRLPFAHCAERVSQVPSSVDFE